MNSPWITYDGRELTDEEMRVDLMKRLHKIMREEEPPLLRLSNDEVIRLYEALRR